MDDVAVKAERRMGPPGSDNWHAMLDSAETILRQEGHAALTSRRVAEVTGVKQRLVYYYFRTMDDLIVEMFRRLSERELKRLSGAATSATPLREIWDVCIRTTDARLISEFMALANRIEGLKSEVVHFIEKSREIQVAALTAALSRSPGASSLPPSSIAIIATSVALSVSREEQLGVSSGHEEVLELIQSFLSAAEPVV
jgi:AcrR family transcriptional regulator